MAKRMYWSKLRADFFNRDPVKLIRAMKGGDSIILFYLQIVQMTLESGGILRATDTMPYSPSMLSTVTGVPLKTVKEALVVLVEFGFIESYDDGTYCIVGFDEICGSETDAAERKRKSRGQQKV